MMMKLEGAVCACKTHERKSLFTGREERLIDLFVWIRVCECERGNIREQIELG